MRGLAVPAVMVALLASGALSAARAQADKTPMQIIEDGRKSERAAIDRQYERARRYGAGEAGAGKRDPWAGARTEDIGKPVESGKSAKADQKRTGRAAKPGAPMQLR